MCTATTPIPRWMVWPGQLYAGLLRALGVPGEQVPPTESEQATVYHQLLDQRVAAGRAVLLVVDNVADPGQVADLLPRGVAGHRVLITSRDTLGGLPGARLLDLEVLESAAAVDLLALGLRRRHPSDPRTIADPDAAAELVELCGRLPLAVQIMAALLADEPHRSLEDAVAQLSDENHRLRDLDCDGRWAVRAAPGIVAVAVTAVGVVTSGAAGRWRRGESLRRPGAGRGHRRGGGGQVPRRGVSRRSRDLL